MAWRSRVDLSSARCGRSGGLPRQAPCRGSSTSTARRRWTCIDFWEPIWQRGSLVLDPDQFYILASKEAVRVPPAYAAEMVPFNPLVGEFRVHYAGFFDPGFGHSSGNGEGARAVLEVRSHEVPFILEDGQIIGRLVYEPLTEAPDAGLWPGHRLELPAPGAEAVEALQALRPERSGDWCNDNTLIFVIAGFIPATHCSAYGWMTPAEPWVPATSAGMTKGGTELQLAQTPP